MLNRIRVYDMDGTIVSSLHRYRTIMVDGQEKIDLPYWRENSTPEMIAKDSFLPLFEQYKSDLNDPTCYVIIATARVMSPADWEFVDKMGAPDKFYSRPAGSDRRGADLKASALRSLFSLRQFARILDRVFYEDNHDYLAISDELGMVPVFVPSKQGH